MTFGSTALLLSLALRADDGIADSARLVDGRLLIEPVGASLVVPPVWLGGPRPAYYPRAWCANQPSGTVRDRVVIERARFATLRSVRGEWSREYSAAVDSALPFTGLVAQLGAAPWTAGCVTMQLRAYVVDRSGAALDSAAARAAVAAGQFFTPVTREHSDSAGWHVNRVGWAARYADYGGPARVEFWSRPVGIRTVVLVFMFGFTATEAQERDRDAVIGSLTTVSARSRP